MELGAGEGRKEATSWTRIVENICHTHKGGSAPLGQGCETDHATGTVIGLDQLFAGRGVVHRCERSRTRRDDWRGSLRQPGSTRCVHWCSPHNVLLVHLESRSEVRVYSRHVLAVATWCLILPRVTPMALEARFQEISSISRSLARESSCRFRCA